MTLSYLLALLSRIEHWPSQLLFLPLMFRRLMFRRLRHTLPRLSGLAIDPRPLVHTTTADRVQAKQVAIGQARSAQVFHVGDLRVPVLLPSVAGVNLMASVELVAVVRTVNALVMPVIGLVIITGTALDV